MVDTYAFSEIHWTCSDHHFGHPKGRILIHCPGRLRWCTDMASMEQALIASWNAVVRPDQTVLHLGDLSMVRRKDLREFIPQLNGRIILVRGNHDLTLTASRDCGLKAHKAVRIEDTDGRIITCRHDPKDFTQAEVDESALLIHGHLHGKRAFSNCMPGTEAKARDVGVDAIDSHSPLEWEWSNLYDANIRP